MKKILSLALAAIMLLGAVPMVNAAEVTENHDYSNGTAITLVGTGTEEYTVTVPAKMTPGDTGTVKAEGMWAADKYLQVSAPTSVALTYGAQSMDVAITFDTDEQKMRADLDGDGDIAAKEARKIGQLLDGKYASGAINGTAATE